MSDEKTIKEFHVQVKAIQTEIATEMVGQEKIVRQLLIAIICGGNVLLEGVPGLGKTRLVRTLGRVLDLQFSRIQFTPDLMPADVTGTNIVMKDAAGQNVFTFQKGPVFSNIVLADEINRATPKTQSALLEAMQEHTVSVSGESHHLPEPFFVLATQNPMEQEGTYPLPEAQLDRFFFKLWVEFPKLDELRQIVDMTTGVAEKQAKSVAGGDAILQMRAVAKEVPIADAVRDYALRLVLSTHSDSDIAAPVTKQFLRYGASPRAAQAMILAAKAQALFEGRYNVSFDDVRYVAYPVLRHRIVCNFEALSKGETTETVIARLLTEVTQTGGKNG